MQQQGFPFTISTMLTREEFVRIMRQQANRKQKRIWVAFALLIPLLSNFYFHFRRHESASIVQDAVSFLIIFVLLLAYIIMRARVGFGKAYDDNPRLHSTIHYTFSDEGVATWSDGFKTEIVWPHFYKIEQVKDGLLLYSSRRIASVLKKADLTEEQIALIESKVKK